jgi:hypothetical protein
MVGLIAYLVWSPKPKPKPIPPTNLILLEDLLGYIAKPITVHNRQTQFRGGFIMIIMMIV